MAVRDETRVIDTSRQQLLESEMRDGDYNYINFTMRCDDLKSEPLVY